MRRRSLPSLLLCSSLVLGACRSAPEPAPETDTPEPAEAQAEAPAEAPDEDAQEQEPEEEEDAGASRSAELDAATKAALSETIRGHLPELQSCYEPELAKDPQLQGKMTYTITVERTGSVRTVSVDVDTVESEAVQQCTVAQIKSWRFDGSDLEESADVTFSVAFAAV